MTWTKIDEGYRSHPKVLAAGPDGMSLDVAGMTYANQHGTDGFLPVYAIPTLFPVKSVQRVVTRLIEVRRWHDADEKDCKCRLGGPPPPGPGCWIHDFLEYNPSAVDVAAEKEERSRRGKAGAVARWHGGKHGGRHTNGQGETHPPSHGGKNAPSRSVPKDHRQSSSEESPSTASLPTTTDEILAETWAILAVRDEETLARETGQHPRSRKAWLRSAANNRRDDHESDARRILEMEPRTTPKQLADSLAQVGPAAPRPKAFGAPGSCSNDDCSNGLVLDDRGDAVACPKCRAAS